MGDLISKELFSKARGLGEQLFFYVGKTLIQLA